MPDTSAGDGAARRLKEFWVHGAGAARIGWGTPGDFDRCVLQLGEHVRDPEGLCNTYHQAAVGAPPGKGHGESATSKYFNQALRGTP